MNFQIIHKIIALPLSASENSVALVLAYHTQKDGNSCFPSYETIRKESGASPRTISKVIRTLKYAGVIDYRHRASVTTGKESNEYSFVFNGIGFFRNKLTKDKVVSFTEKIKKARVQAIADMRTLKERRRIKKRKKGVPIQSHFEVPIQSQMSPIQKPQNFNNEVRAAQGLRGERYSDILQRYSDKCHSEVLGDIVPLERESNINCIDESTFRQEVKANHSQDSGKAALIEENYLQEEDLNALQEKKPAIRIIA